MWLSRKFFSAEYHTTFIFNWDARHYCDRCDFKEIIISALNEWLKYRIKNKWSSFIVHVACNSRTPIVIRYNNCWTTLSTLNTKLCPQEFQLFNETHSKRCYLINMLIRIPPWMLSTRVHIWHFYRISALFSELFFGAVEEFFHRTLYIKNVWSLCTHCGHSTIFLYQVKKSKLCK